MYRPAIRPRDRAATIALVMLIHVGLGLAFLNLSGHLNFTQPQPNLQIFDLNVPPPPPPVVEVVKQDKAKPKKQEAAASAKNIESKATPVVRPKPRVIVPAPPVIVSAPTPNVGNKPTQGASNVVGPGTGAGGSGTGTGSGGSGNGSGGGGSGGQATRVKMVQFLSSRDYPDAIIRRWPRGAPIFVRLRVEANGSVSRCDVMRSFGDALADQWTCALLLQQKAKFRPATDSTGRPISAWFGYIQAPTGGMYSR
ncbi:MAG: energy transducer TonB [Sphingomicrobium sp.]